MSPSNTPTPPGTRPIIPSRIAMKKIPKNGRKGQGIQREQHVEHGAGQRPVDHREQQLRHGNSRRRQREFESPNSQWRPPKG